MGAARLFASDLDGTLLPNGVSPPPSGVIRRTIEALRVLRIRGIPISYVTGRHYRLALRGIAEFDLPRPDHWICNVGTEVRDANGELEPGWLARLGPALDLAAIDAAFARTCTHGTLQGGAPALRLQEPERQGRHKVSFYCLTGPLPTATVSALEQGLNQSNVSAGAGALRLIASADVGRGHGLLDVVPRHAGKAAAIAFLAEVLGVALADVVFAGDSGNDLDALTCGVLGVLVGNADGEVRKALTEAARAPEGALVYHAQAVYGDGVIEGLRHYGWLADRA